MTVRLPAARQSTLRVEPDCAKAQEMSEHSRRCQLVDNVNIIYYYWSVFALENRSQR